MTGNDVEWPHYQPPIRIGVIVSADAKTRLTDFVIWLNRRHQKREVETRKPIPWIQNTVMDEILLDTRFWREFLSEVE